MAKRSSLLGRGADIFLSEEPVAPPQEQAQPERQSQPEEHVTIAPEALPPPASPVKSTAKGQAKKQRRSKEETVKLTVYIRPELDTRLDQLWLQRRMKDVNAQKSLLVEDALQLLFDREAITTP